MTFANTPGGRSPGGAAVTALPAPGSVPSSRRAPHAPGRPCPSPAALAVCATAPSPLVKSVYQKVKKISTNRTCFYLLCELKASLA